MTGAPAATFNPGYGKWRITTRLQPTLLTIGGTPQLPTAPPESGSCGTTCPQHFPSYNIVQKGRNGVTGGFYKIEIMGYSKNNFSKGSVHCTFMDADGTGTDAYSGNPNYPTPVVVSVKAYYTIDCSRTGDKISLTVSQKVGSTTSTETEPGSALAGGTLGGDGKLHLDDVSPTNTPAASSTRDAYAPKFSIGKKPDSTNTGDAFAGKVDYVTVSTEGIPAG